MRSIYESEVFPPLRRAIDLPVVLLDGSWAAYVAVGSVLFAGTVLLAVHPRLARDGRPALPFFVLLALTLAFFRWPGVTCREPFNRDESVLIAGALTLRHDPVFWRSVHGTTSGPLNVYPLMLPALVGLPLDHASARIVGLAMLLAALFLTHRTSRLVSSEHVARMAVLPAWSFLGLCTHWDLVHYSSEHVSIVLLSAGTYLAARALDPRSRCRLLTIASAGFLMGCVPFAKLQAVPAALWITAFLYLSALGADASSRLRGVVALTLAGLLPFALIAGGVRSLNIEDDFWTSYVGWNLNHASRPRMPLDEGMRRTLEAIFHGHETAHVASGVVAAAVLSSVVIGASRYLGPVGLQNRSRGPRADLARDILFLTLPLPLLYAIAVSGNAGKPAFDHYKLFLVFPATLVLGRSYGAARAALDRRPGSPPGMRGILAGGFLILAVLPPLAHRLEAIERNPHLRPASYYRTSPVSPVAARILAHTPRDRPLAVWGWAPELYVETQRRQATTFATTEREIAGFRCGDFRRRFLEDMRANRPPIFVDETGPSSTTYRDRARFGHEVFPELRELVRANYRDLGEIRGVRIYRLRDEPTGQDRP